MEGDEEESGLGDDLSIREIEREDRFSLGKNEETKNIEGNDANAVVQTKRKNCLMSICRSNEGIRVKRGTVEQYL